MVAGNVLAGAVDVGNGLDDAEDAGCGLVGAVDAGNELAGAEDAGGLARGAPRPMPFIMTSAPNNISATTSDNPFFTFKNPFRLGQAFRALTSGVGYAHDYNTHQHALQQHRRQQ